MHRKNHIPTRIPTLTATRFFPLTIALAALVALFAISGCASLTGGTPGADNTQGTAPVAISMTDDPPQGVSVLFFQVQLTAASLTPASTSSTSGSSSTSTSVSLLPNNTPITVDVTKLQALSAFLSTANVPAGSYSSLNLAFANPQLVIYNASDSSISSDCAVGTVCVLTPTIDNSANVTISSSPFPVTVSAGSPLGFLVDFHLNTIIQPDLTVDLSAANGVTVNTLPHTHPAYGFLTGAVSNVNTSADTFTLTTLWGRSFTIDASSSTTYTNFPAGSSGTSTTASISSLTDGEIVQVQISGIVDKDTLDASQVQYIQAANELTVQGVIVGITPATSTTSGSTTTTTPASFTLLLHDNFTNNPHLPPGASAVATLDSGAKFSIDDNGFTIPAGLTFASATDLAVGQEVTVTIDTTTLTSSSATANAKEWGPPPKATFNVNAVALEPSQLTGDVGTPGTDSFPLDNPPNFWWWWFTQPKVEATVDTTTATTYNNFTTDSFSGLEADQLVSVSGWLFNTPASTSTATTATTSARRADSGSGSGSNTTATPPTIVAQTITLHNFGWF